MGIRREIQQRRQDRIRQLMQNNNDHNQSEQQEPRNNPLFYEERPPLFNDPEYAWKRQNQHLWENERKGPKSGKGFISRLLLSIFMYAILWSVFHVDTPWAAQGRQDVKMMFTQNLHFTSIQSWYENHFHSIPSWLPAFQNKSQNATKVNVGLSASFFSPAAGQIEIPFSTTQTGIVLQTNANSPIDAMTEGRVIFAGQQESTGLTVIIQHANGYQTIYGELRKSLVQKDDWVRGGQTIGVVSVNQDNQQGTFYFSIMKNGKYVNPTEVVTFD